MSKKEIKEPIFRMIRYFPYSEKEIEKIFKKMAENIYKQFTRFLYNDGPESVDYSEEDNGEAFLSVEIKLQAQFDEKGKCISFKTTLDNLTDKIEKEEKLELKRMQSLSEK